MIYRINIAVSALFHPVWVNLLTTWLLFVLFPELNNGLPAKLKQFMILFVFVVTGVVPVLVLGFLRLTGKINSIMLNAKEDRRWPYLITMLLYFFCFYNFYKLNAPNILLKYLLGCTIIVLFVALVNNYYKISIHATSMGALLGVLMAACAITQTDLRPIIAATILLGGFVCNARLLLNAHTTDQLFIGYLTGTVAMFLILH